MKRVLAGIAVIASLVWFSPVYAEHLEIRNASNLTAGTLPNARIDYSSNVGRPSQWSYDIDLATTALKNVIAADTTTLATRIGSVAVLRPYTMLVGTQGALGVDTYITSLAGYVATLATFNAAGLTYSTSGYGTIFWGNGLFDLTGATNPAGVNWVCSDSTTFVVNGANKTGITNYGTIGDSRGSPCYIDGGGQVYDGQAYVAKSWSVNNVNFTGFQNLAANSARAAPDQRCVFCAITSSETRGNLWFTPNGFRANASALATNKGGQAPMALTDTLNARFNVRTSTWVPGPDTSPLGRVFLSMKSTTNTLVNFDSEYAGNNWVHLTKDNRRPTIMGNATIRSEGTSLESDSAFIAFDYQGGAYASSGTFIGPMKLRVLGANSFNLIKLGSNGAAYKNFNTTIFQVVAFCEDPTNTYTFLTTGSDAVNTNIEGVFIGGCANGVVDSGAGSKARYYKDGILFSQ